LDGWFDQTIPQWMNKYEDIAGFIHIDCDVYPSTKNIFDLLGPRITPGCIIVFDEYFGYPGWQQNEFKAFQEFIFDNKIEYKYLGFSRIQVAVQILGVYGKKS